MLSAVTHTSMGDGVEGADEITNALQNHIAILTSHEEALFVLSGTMGNLLALRYHLTNPPYAVLCDSRAHFLNSEAGGTFTWPGAVAQPVQASNGRHLTLEDILPHVKLDDGVSVHAVPTRVIVIENTLAGLITPFAEAQRICEFAHENGIKVHLDGARLWEAATAETDSLDETKQYLKEYCRLFDSVTMCFSKGLGVPVGAILVGQKTFIRRAT
jgi:threonine aldolase